MPPDPQKMRGWRPTTSHQASPGVGPETGALALKPALSPILMAVFCERPFLSSDTK